MATFQERFNLAYRSEADRRNDEGLPKLTKTEVWKAAGKSSGAFTHWANGSNGMDLDTCMKVSQVLGVNPHWLFDESQPKNMLPSPGIQQRHKVEESPVQYQVANLLSLASLNRLKENPDNYVIREYETGGSMGHGLVLREQPGVIHNWQVNGEWLEKNARNHTGVQNLCIVTGFGDSMRPLYNPGDPLLVDRGVKSMDYDGIYFFRVGEEGFIKRLQKVPSEDGMTIWATSANKDYKDFQVTSKMDFEVLGRVIRVWCGTDF